MNNDLEKKYIDTLMKRMNEILKPKKPEIIFEAMAYSVNAGGKRVRPILLLEACRNECGDFEKAIDHACAMEMIHTYSLIHDDLPAMDNDDLRRGMPTCHKKFGEAEAILAGDGLLNTAFEIMSDKASKELVYAKAMSVIAHRAGTGGMIGGQVLDVISEGKKISPEDLEFIHTNKTAALISASLEAGAIIGGADEKRVELYKNLGKCVGIAFQIKDDILDVTSTETVLGKPILSDEKNEKVTYVSMYSLEKANEDYKMLSDKSLEIAEQLSGKESFLYEYLKKLVDRIN